MVLLAHNLWWEAILIKKLDYIHYDKGILFVWKHILILHTVLEHEYSADVLELDPSLPVIGDHFSFDHCKIKIGKKKITKSMAKAFTWLIIKLIYNGFTRNSVISESI